MLSNLECHLVIQSPNPKAVIQEESYQSLILNHKEGKIRNPQENFQQIHFPSQITRDLDQILTNQSTPTIEGQLKNITFKETILKNMNSIHNIIKSYPKIYAFRMSNCNMIQVK